MPAKSFDAGRVAKIEPEYLETMPPLFEVGFGSITRGRVARETGRDNELGSGAQKLDSGLVTDLNAPAGQESDAAAQIGQLGSFAEVQIGASRTKLVVKV